MAKPTYPLIKALRKSASRIAQGARYEWGHVGRCNCGHLVQSVTNKSESEIFRSFGPALDEWSEHANDYCPSTGMPVDAIFDQLAGIGFTNKDVQHLEYLSDRNVLKRLGPERNLLQKNKREDVVLYMSTMADLLEEQLV